jgi:phytoene dehydrogenase-like protein
MSHECEDCGEQFETRTEKRVHDCPGEAGGSASSEIETEYGDELADYRARIENDEFGALYGGLAALEAAQEAAHDADADAYRDLFDEYFQPFADGLDRVAREEGWSALAEFIEAYDPRTGTFPHVSGVIENAVGRFVVRTRLEDGVDAIPADALAYLRAVPPACPSGADVAFEEAATYGWGIGHPEEPVADHLHEMADEHRYWVGAALETAVYADQAAAVEVLSRIVTDGSISFTVPHSLLVVGAPRFFLSAAVRPEIDRDPTTPRDWDWQSKYDYTFEWDPEVKTRIRDLATETGATEDLPADWTLASLAI